MEAYRQELESYLKINRETACSEEETKQLEARLAAGEAFPAGYRRSPENVNIILKAQGEKLDLDLLERRMRLQQAKHIATIKNCLVTILVVTGALALLQLIGMLP